MDKAGKMEEEAQGWQDGGGILLDKGGENPLDKGRTRAESFSTRGRKPS